MNLCYRITFIIAILSCYFSFGQDPMYYTIGENELGNIDVYSLLEDNEGNLFISSDDGLYRYQNGTFFHYPLNKNQKNIALFFLVETTKGDIFCLNLKGQVYKVKNRELELFYSIPKNELIAIPYLLTDEEGNLIVISKKITVLNPEKKVVKKISNFSFIQKNKDGKIIVGKTLKEYYYLHKLGNYTLPKSTIDSEIENQIITKITPKKNNKLFIEADENDILDNYTNSLIQLDKKTFLVRLRNGGIREYTINSDTIRQKKSFYQDTYISAINAGKYNLYVGTFKQGIRVIPNYNFVKLNHSFPNRSIIDFNFNTNNFLLKIRKKGLIQFDYRSKASEFISLHPNSEILSLPNIEINSTKFPNVLLDYQFVSAIKDITKVNSKTVLLASSEGLLQLNTSSETEYIGWDTCNLKSNLFETSKVKERCYSVEFDSLNNVIFVGTQSGLLRISRQGISEITFSNQSIVANDLIFKNEILYIGTKNCGVLKYQHRKTTTLFNDKNGLFENWVKKIVFQNDHLFVLNKNFFQRIDLFSGKITPLNRPEGIIGFVNQFQIYNDTLWILTNNSNIISVATNKIDIESSKLEFKIDSIIIGGQSINLNQPGVFSYKENNLKILTHFKNDAYRQNTKIKYQLVGFEDDWNELPSNLSEINYKRLPVGKYQLVVLATYGHFTPKFTYSFEIKAPFWRRTWFLILCILVGLILIILYFRLKMKQQRIRAQKRILKQQINNDLTEAKLTALRSQMNPHFIFNALNSIQNLILKKDVHTSYDYIVLFSKLVRNTLRYSEKEFIGIEEEISFLDVYLRLEKLRFGESFCYSIESNGVKNIDIPPLLIQPFIENALLHGLLNKKGDKQLFVEFKFNDKELLCEIVDNGIGREKAKEIKKRQGINRKSFALNAIQKRLSIMKDKFGKDIGYSIEDLYENQKSTGTKVTINIPYQ